MGDYLEQFSQDVRFAVRSIRRTPGFSLVAILTLALGIGATTAMYSVVDSILLQPLPFAYSDRMVRVVENFTGGLTAGRVFQRGVSYQDFLEWRRRTATLSDLVAFTSSVLSVGTSEGTVRLWNGGVISPDAFASLGVRPILGRTLTSGDESDATVVVLGFDAWRRLFHSDIGIIGKTMEVRGADQGRHLTIVGVLPAGFEFPTGPMDFYLPLDPSRPHSNVTLIGRLRPGVPMRAAQDEASVIGRSIRPPRPASAASLPVARFEVQGLKDQIVKDLRPALRVLLTSVAVVLMIVCANVANLLLARATARRREMAVRFAIGAGRARIVRQVLTECLVLAAAGGILGVILGAAGVTLVKQFATIDAPGVFRLGLGSAILPRTMEMGVDRRMLSIALGITTIACGLFGLLPALQVSRAARFQALSARGASASIAATGTRSLLVVGQLVLATVLLVSAGLLVNSFVRLSTVDKGYDASHALAMQIVFPGDYALPRRADLIDTLLARLRRHPDVEFAGFSRAGVLIGEEIAMGVFIPHGRTLGEMRAQPAAPRLRSVTQGFLPAMGIRFVDGRDFDGPAAAAAAPPVVINRSAANHLFGTERALGQVLDWDLEKFRIQVRVIGVVDNLRNESLEQEPFPEIFIDYRALWSVLQRLGDSPPRQTQTALGVLSFAIRTKGDPNAAIPAVRQIVHSVDPDTGIDAIVPIDRLVSSSVARQRFYAVILGVFAGVAGALASIGVYGVLAYAVVQRTQEIGIRMALGAQRAHVLALVLRKGAMLTTVGVGLGLLSAVAVTRLLRGMLFGVTPLDLQTFLAVSIMFFAVAALASYLPARGATLVDPLVALRRDE